MSQLPLACLVLAATLVGGCSSLRSGAGAPLVSQESSRAYLGARNLPAHGVALEGYCPVAYFAVGRPLRGSAEHASTHRGVTYHFVSADAKAAFDADPEHYLPAFGGWCAFGMAVEDKFPVDPTAFKIVDGRLLVFLRNDDIDALALWEDGHEQQLLRQAEAHWARVQG